MLVGAGVYNLEERDHLILEDIVDNRTFLAYTLPFSSLRLRLTKTPLKKNRNIVIYYSNLKSWFSI